MRGWILSGLATVLFGAALITPSNGLRNLQYLAPGGTSRTAYSKLSDVVSVKDFCGDTIPTDATTCVQTAIDTGKNVMGVAGDTYVIAGGLTQSTTGQVINMTGATVKLANSAASHGMLTLSGAGARVTGGTWDQNGANNASGDQFGHFAVLLSADNASVDHIYALNSYGIGIKGAANKNHLSATYNRVEGAQLIGIYFDADANDIYDAKIDDNEIDVSATTSAQGIYIASASPFAQLARRWSIRGNRVVGSASATSSAVGITARGVDGVVSGNRIQGFTIGISADITLDSRVVVTSNHVTGINGTTGYGIEVNGGHSVISGNRVVGGKIGISCTSQALASSTLDGMAITGNILTDQTTEGILVQPGTGFTANRMNISANTITNSTASGVRGIYLAKDCRYSEIAANVLHGPGSGNANSRAIYLDTVNSDVAITGNKLSGWERAVGVFNASAVAQNNISFLSNEVANDIGNASSTVLLNLEGSATWGTGVKIFGNNRGSASSTWDEWMDRGSGIRFTQDNSFSTPEANVTSGIGSLYIKLANAGPSVWVKETGGNSSSGWAPVYTARRVAPTYGASVAIDAGAGTEQVITATNGTAFTVANPTNATTGRHLIVMVRNTSGGALGVVTWDTLYKVVGGSTPWTVAVGNGFSRSIEFIYDGTNWIELWRGATDVPN